MGFMIPQAGKVVKTPVSTDANAAKEATTSDFQAPPSLITTSASGLEKKAKTVKPSLIGGSINGN